MKKFNLSIIFSLIVICSINYNFTHALTTVSFGTGGECITGGTNGDLVETKSCFGVYTTTIFNDIIYPGPVNITVQHTMDSLNSQSLGMLRCTNNTVYAACGPYDILTSFLDYPSWGTLGKGFQGTVAPTLTAGSYSIGLNHIPKGDSFPSGCNDGGIRNCSVMSTQDSTSGGTLVVSAAPAVTVNVNFSMYLEKAVEHLLALFGVNNAYAESK